MKETELAAAIIVFFSDDYEIFKEVPAYGIIDIVAYLKPIVIGIECKTSFNLDVIAQADKNKGYCHYSYVAVPKPRSWGGFAATLCRERGIGVLMLQSGWRGTPVITEMVKPRLNRRIVPIALHDWQKESEAGCQSGRMTAFKNTVRELKDILQRHGGRMTITDAIKGIDHHYGSFSGAKASLMARIRQGVIVGIEYDKGILKIVNP
jgi:hypothetical protein